MFAFKSSIEIPARVVLIAVIIINALVPTAASALSMPEPAEDAPPSVPIAIPQGIKGSTGYLSSSPRSPFVFQDGTPIATPTATNTETLTPEPSLTPVGTAEETTTPEPTVEGTPTPSPTLEGTPTATQASPTPTTLPALSIQYAAAPVLAKAGDRVTFTLTIANTGTLPVGGLLFSNILPEGFHDFQSEGTSFSFDRTTRTLTWKRDVRDSAGQIPAGGTLTLTYSVLVEPAARNVEIIDTANLSADGLIAPLLVETSFTLLSAEGSLTAVDSRGGEAVGLDGRIKVKLPEQSLEAPAAVFIEDLTTETPGEPQTEPWLQFKLELHEAQPNDPSIPVPNPDGQEEDRTIPLQPIEAEFQEPVELSGSFDGLLDLATLTGEFTPFLVTLDETSGTWIRIPLKQIDREQNIVTAELPHFSVWAVGIGTSVPQNGANVLLYHSGYSSLFTGRSEYSLPIWTPPGRNGMAPSLALSYSSGVADGILGDVQAPWLDVGGPSTVASPVWGSIRPT